MGPKKYPKAADNVRFFPDDVEDGIWQQGQTAVSKKLAGPPRSGRGQITATVRDGRREPSEVAVAVGKAAGLSPKRRNCSRRSWVRSALCRRVSSSSSSGTAKRP